MATAKVILMVANSRNGSAHEILASTIGLQELNGFSQRTRHRPLKYRLDSVCTPMATDA